MKDSFKLFSKRFLALLLIMGAIFSANEIIASSMSNVIHDIVEEQELAEGVKYENIKRFTKTGWWNINLVRIDISNKDNEIKGLISDKGISNRETVTTLTNQNNALAGINGDFFEYSPIPHSTGGLIQDGEVITSPVEKAYAWPSFLINNKGDAEVLLLERAMSTKSLRSGEGARLQMINKAKSVSNMPNASVMYNKHWGYSTPGNKLTKDVIEIVVDNNIVTEIRDNQGPVKLENDRYVIHLRGSFKNDVKNFQVGDEIKLTFYSEPNLGSIQFMISGGSQILKNGTPMETHLVLKGNQPRTAIGVNKDNTEIVLATIDGRHSTFSGVSQKTFGTILKDLGMYNAVNLDGGGSTTMSVKKPTDDKSKLVNNPSDSGQRKVANGVGVISNAEKGKLQKIEIKSADNNIIKNSSRDFEVNGLDGHLSKVDIDKSKVKLTVEGVEGKFDGFKFTPTTSGKGKIIAKYENYEVSTDIRVLDNIVSLDLPYESFNMDGNSKHYINPIYGKDGNGYKALIYPRDIQFSVTNELGEFKDGWFHSKDITGSGAITLKYENVVNNIIVSIGSKNVKVDNFGNMENINFEVYPKTVTGGISLSEEVKTGKNSIKLSYDFPKADSNRAAYLSFKNPLSIKDVRKIGLWVKGDNSNAMLRGNILDTNNKEHSIDFAKTVDFNDWKYLEANISSNINPKLLNKIYVVETDKTKTYTGSILLDGLTFSYSPSTDNIDLPQVSKFADSKNIKSEIKDGGYSFVITRLQDSLNNITGSNALETIQKKSNNHNVGIYMGGIPKGYEQGLNNELVINSGSPYYLGKNYKNTLFMNINANAGGIRAQSAEQWSYIKNSINASTDTDHIVAIISKPVFGTNGFKDQLEAKVLHDILSQSVEAGKTVWVIQNGTQNRVNVMEGIRYIEFDGRNVNNNTIKNLKSIEFIVNDKDITYQINSIF